MTETPETAAEAVETTTPGNHTTNAPEAVSEAAGAENGKPGQGKANAEAAKYRTQRNELRAELEAAQERIAKLQRAEAERLASEVLAEPSDLFTLGGKELADLLDEHGDLNAEAIAATAKAIVEARPGLANRRGLAVDKTPPGRPVGPAGPSWHEALQSTSGAWIE